MNITIDDVSPQFQYITVNSSTTGWFANHTDDNRFSSYFQNTFYGTHEEGDYVKLKFNGSAVTIYGAKRDNHGVYSTQLDGGSTSFQLGYSVTALFQQVLFQASGLSTDTEHEVILKNLPSQSSVAGSTNTEWWFDIDYAVITTSTTGKVYTTEYDDASTAVQYFGSGWGKGPPLSPDYHDQTAHITNALGDSMQLKFNGSSIQVFGGLYIDHGNYSVSIDGAKSEAFNGTFYKIMPGATLYHASNLKDGPHTLLLTNLGQSSAGTFFDFDYAVVNSTIDPAASPSNASSAADSTSTSTVSGTSGSSGNAGAIAGGVVGAIVGLALVAVLAWFLFRRSKQRADDGGYVEYSKDRGVGILDGEEVKPFPHYGSGAAAGMAASAAGSHGYSGQGQGGQGAYSAYGASSRTRGFSHDPTVGHSPPQQAPYLTHIPAPPPSNATSYPRSVAPPSSTGAGSPPPLPAGAGAYANPFTGGTTSTRGGQGSPRFAEQQGARAVSDGGGDMEQGSSSAPRASGKSMGAALPYTARPPPLTLSSTPVAPSTTASISPRDEGPSQAPFRRERVASQGSLDRMYEPGREQDMGPLGAAPGAGAEEEEGRPFGALPPDYNQATEPLPGQRAP
ncbi:hypothetical protein IAT38_006607 [Cryptococcus sp. DSM 104549]